LKKRKSYETSTTMRHANYHITIEDKRNLYQKFGDHLEDLPWVARIFAKILVYPIIFIWYIINSPSRPFSGAPSFYSST